MAQQDTQKLWLIHEHNNSSNSIDYYHLYDSHDDAYEFLKNYVQDLKKFICMDYLREVYDDENENEYGDEDEDDKSYDDFVKEYIKNPPDNGTIYFTNDHYIVITKFYKNYAKRP